MHLVGTIAIRVFTVAACVWHIRCRHIYSFAEENKTKFTDTRHFFFRLDSIILSFCINKLSRVSAKHRLVAPNRNRHLRFKLFIQYLRRIKMEFRTMKRLANTATTCVVRTSSNMTDERRIRRYFANE